MLFLKDTGPVTPGAVAGDRAVLEPDRPLAVPGPDPASAGGRTSLVGVIPVKGAVPENRDAAGTRVSFNHGASAPPGGVSGEGTPFDEGTFCTVDIKVKPAAPDGGVILDEGVLQEEGPVEVVDASARPTCIGIDRRRVAVETASLDSQVASRRV